ncbi:Transcription initiation factor TFIID subunit 1 [Binucleata daphniae]
MRTPKFTDLLVNPKPYEYVLLPYRPKRFTQIHFEQDEIQNLVLTQDRPKVHYYKKIKYDRNAYVPLEYVNWESNLEEMLESTKDKKITPNNNNSTDKPNHDTEILLHKPNDDTNIALHKSNDDTKIALHKPNDDTSKVCHKPNDKTDTPLHKQCNSTDIQLHKQHDEISKTTHKHCPTDTPFKNDLSLHLFFEDVFSQKWESFIDKPPHHLILYYQDPNLIFTNVEKKRKKKNKYNLSNDKHYEIKKTKKEDNLNVYGVQHSVPALRLEPTYYKTHLTKEDLRQYCKNYTSIKNIRFKFVNIKDNKPVFIKKKEDLTLQDNSDVCLIEYCDEYPMFINKEGMVSLINNYIKEGSKEIGNQRRRARVEKKMQSNKTENVPVENASKEDTHIDADANNNTDDTKNETVKKEKTFCVADFSEQDRELLYRSADKIDYKRNENYRCVTDLFNFSVKKRKIAKEDGQTYKLKDVLINSHEPSPLQNVTLKPGHQTTLLTNNMFKAPLYNQKIKMYIITYKTKDKKNENMFCEATIKPVHLFTCGFVFPLIEIFSPHSKSLNLYCKNRLKIAANTMSDRMIKMKDLDDMFPSFSEGSKRKWLKEYTERKKDSTYVLNYKDDEITIIPENVVQYESMLLSERLLKDKIIENEECYWNATRNFLKGNIEIESRDDFYGEKISYQRSIKENLNDMLTKKFYEQENILNKESKVTEIRESDMNKIKNIERQETVKITAKDKIKHSCNTNDVKESKVTQKQSKNNLNTRSILIKRIINDVIEEELITDEDVINEYLKERKKIKEHVKKSQLKCGRCGAIGHMKTNKTCPFYAEAGKMSKKKKEALKRKMKGIICEIILNVLQSIFGMQLGSVFHKPVNVKKFTNYLQFVSEPIDLGTIRVKARQNKYKKYSDFVNDIKLMRDNCIKYNGVEHSFSKVAEEMYEIAVKRGKEKQEEIEEAEKNIEEMEVNKNEEKQSETQKIV